MSTGNFYSKNASKIYAVLMDYERPKLDDDGNETDETETVGCEDFEIEDLTDEMDELFTELAAKKKYHFSEDGKTREDSRDDGIILGDISKSKSFGDVEVDVIIQMIMRSGHYEGACLDWNCTIRVNDEEADDIDFDFEKFFEYYSEMPKGMQVIQRRNAERFADHMKDELIGAVEGIFTKVSMPLVVTARFSNGETMYAKA